MKNIFIIYLLIYQAVKVTSFSKALNNFNNKNWLTKYPEGLFFFQVEHVRKKQKNPKYSKPNFIKKGIHHIVAALSNLPGRLRTKRSLTRKVYPVLFPGWPKHGKWKISKAQRNNPSQKRLKRSHSRRINNP